LSKDKLVECAGYISGHCDKNYGSVILFLDPEVTNIYAAYAT
jgi:hypothetical protein